MDTTYQTMPSLRSIFDGAKSFGLSDDEVWRMANESMQAAGADATVSDYLDELAGALARSILHKERRAFPKRR
jgi:hypothetical protein